MMLDVQNGPEGMSLTVSSSSTMVDVIWFVNGARRAESAKGGVVDGVWFFDGI
jgi:hypothetical protein